MSSITSENDVDCTSTTCSKKVKVPNPDGNAIVNVSVNGYVISTAFIG